MDRKDFRFFHALRVRWAEVDRQNVVFNGHYLTYFDVAITEYWRAIGAPYPAVTERWGTDLLVVKATIEYHGSAQYDQMLEIGVRVARIGGSSMRFSLGIFDGDAHLVSGEVIYVNVVPETRKSAPVPVGLRALIAALEDPAPRPGTTA
ncbi:MAG: thioesterase family protein [Betaproteobacteria bacterium]